MKNWKEEVLIKQEAEARSLYAKMAGLKPTEEMPLTEIEKVMWNLNCWANELKYERVRRQREARKERRSK